MFTVLKSLILEILFPSFCPLCKTKVNESGAWCDECLAFSVQKLKITAVELKYLDECLILCHYQEGVNKIIKGLKYYNQLKYCDNILWLLNRLEVVKAYANIDIVVPVPLSAKRFSERGYNQSEKMYKPWALEHNLNWQNLLTRIKETKPQYQLNLKERKENVKNAFNVKKDFCIKGKNILLVDDVYTTGSTLAECAKVLKKAGAKEVRAVALAINI